MFYFVLKRLILVPITVWLIGSVIFLVSNFIPGTYADRQLERNDLISRRIVASTPVNTPLFYFSLSDKVSKDTQWLPDFQWHGLNNQYHQWVSKLVLGNLGNSYRDSRPVITLLTEALFNTLFLLGASLLLIFSGAIKLSQWLVSRNKGERQSLILTFLYIVDSIPLFIIALLLLTFLAGSGYLSFFPVFGLGINTAETNGLLRFVNHIHHMALPLFCLVITGLPYVTAQLYKVMQEVKTHDFITTARAKGLGEQQVLKRHVFRNALLPLITIFTGYLPVLISGAVIIEIIFAIPGTGRLLSESIQARDYPVVMGIVLSLATIRVLSNLLADLLYFTADPRTRQAHV